MKAIISALLLGVALLLPVRTVTAESAKIVNTPYKDMKVVFDFYLDDPAKLNTALYWIRSYMNPLMEAPYNMAPEFIDIVVVIHGTEIVTLAKKNYRKYKRAVDRMKYYTSLGVRFRVCALAMADFGYKPKDLHGFVEVAPSAITELAWWQQKGYGLVTPRIMEKKFSIEEIR